MLTREDTAEARAIAVGETDRLPIHTNKVVRWSLLAAGTVFVGLGILGIFLPLLPTTVFFLMAAWCYARSSQRFYTWIHRNKWFGPYISNYRAGKGITLTTKIITLALLWASVLSSAIYATDSVIVQVLLILIAVGVTIHIVTIPTFKKSA